jgi:hypothetical protein
MHTMALSPPSDGRRVYPARSSAAGKVTLERTLAIEEETHHDIMAMVKAIAEAAGPKYGGFIHLGATSQDVNDTVLALQLAECKVGRKVNICAAYPNFVSMTLPVAGESVSCHDSGAARANPAGTHAQGYRHDRPHPRPARHTHHHGLQAGQLPVRGVCSRGPPETRGGAN